MDWIIKSAVVEDHKARVKFMSIMRVFWFQCVDCGDTVCLAKAS